MKPKMQHPTRKFHQKVHFSSYGSSEESQSLFYLPPFMWNIDSFVSGWFWWYWQKWPLNPRLFVVCQSSLHRLSAQKCRFPSRGWGPNDNITRTFKSIVFFSVIMDWMEALNCDEYTFSYSQLSFTCFSLSPVSLSRSPFFLLYLVFGQRPWRWPMLSHILRTFFSIK